MKLGFGDRHVAEGACNSGPDHDYIIWIGRVCVKTLHPDHGVGLDQTLGNSRIGQSNVLGSQVRAGHDSHNIGRHSVNIDLRSQGQGGCRRCPIKQSMKPHNVTEKVLVSKGLIHKDVETRYDSRSRGSLQIPVNHSERT